MLKNLKNLLNPWTQIKIFVFSMGLLIIIVSGIVGIKQIIHFIADPLNADASIIATTTPIAKKYAYNQLVPKEIIIEEIKRQANLFGLGEKFMLNLAYCESKYDNLAKNPNSTAQGVYQFIFSTWNNTQSGKKKISPYDYKANIRETMIKIADGQYSHWNECLNN